MFTGANSMAQPPGFFVGFFYARLARLPADWRSISDFPAQTYWTMRLAQSNYSGPSAPVGLE
jgi:hypothetical protein